MYAGSAGPHASGPKVLDRFVEDCVCASANEAVAKRSAAITNTRMPGRESRGAAAPPRLDLSFSSGNSFTGDVWHLRCNANIRLRRRMRYYHYKTSGNSEDHCWCGLVRVRLLTACFQNVDFRLRKELCLIYPTS